MALFSEKCEVYPCILDSVKYGSISVGGEIYFRGHFAFGQLTTRLWWSDLEWAVLSTFLWAHPALQLMLLMHMYTVQKQAAAHIVNKVKIICTAPYIKPKYSLWQKKRSMYRAYIKWIIARPSLRGNDYNSCKRCEPYNTSRLMNNSLV